MLSQFKISKNTLKAVLRLVQGQTHTCSARGFSSLTSTSGSPPPSSLVLSSSKNGVFTLKMNNPTKLNAWSGGMIDALREGFITAARDENCKVVILTGEGSYYCAGVSLADMISPMHPRKLRAFLVDSNVKLFETFLSFPKPILVAVNGPAIGASVTSATLCDGIFASENATFSTPFAALGITPEGCSSILFPRRYGVASAKRMLEENWRPTAAEALKIGLVQRVVPSADLLPAAQAQAEVWAKEGRVRSLVADGSLAELRAVNAKESSDLADAFLSPHFLNAQQAFLAKKGKYTAAALFWAISKSRPLWKRLLN